jgi:type VI protein secretion system component VasA
MAVRGQEIEVSMSDGPFDGEGGAFVFGQVLAALFAHEAPLNTFVRTTVRLVTTGTVFRYPALNEDSELR